MAEGDTGATISKEDYDKAVERARNFEAKYADIEKRFSWAKDLNPDQVKADKEALENLMKEKGGTDSKTLDELVARKENELKSRYDGKLTEYETELGSTKTELKRLRVTNVAMNEAASIFNSDALELIQARIEADCDYEDGEIVIKGADGKPLASKLDPRKQMDVKEYLQGLAAKYPSTAKSTIDPGSKSQGEKKSSTASGELSAEKYMAMTPEQRAALPREVQGKLAQQYFRNK